MILNQRIGHFSFWHPISNIVENSEEEFSKLEENIEEEISTLGENASTASKKAVNWGWWIGSIADQYASLSQTTLCVTAERFTAHKVYFESKEIVNVPLWISALKVASYALSLGILPVVALIIKKVFKDNLNACRMLVKDSPNTVITEKLIDKTKIVLLSGSITDETTDVIVNAANSGLWAGGGVCGAIHTESGDQPFDECEEILKTQKRRSINCGEAVITSAGLLAKVKAIVHTVGPDYRRKNEREKGEQLLVNAYRNALEIAHAPHKKPNFSHPSIQSKTFHSIAFPSLSTGIFKAPLEESAALALKTVRDFIKKNPGAFDEVRFIFLPINKDKHTAPAYEQALDELEDEVETTSDKVETTSDKTENSTKKK